jgi:endonuclease/exonuclease/phosphatase family metal-dependent hydrolase
VRLATFNILHGRSLEDGVVDPDRLRAAVTDLDPDILALQEVDRDQPRSHLADLTAVAAEAMGAVAHRFVAALSGTPGATWLAATGSEQPGTASYGIALLSRYPASSWQVVRLPRLGGWVPVVIPGPQRKIVLVKEEPRAAVIGRLDTPLGPLTVANTHLSFIPGWGRRQLRRLRRDLDPFPDPAVIMGDLNMTGATPARVTGYRPLAAVDTFPLAAPGKQLDHVLARGPLPPVTGAQAVATAISDHRALVVDLA